MCLAPHPALPYMKTWVLFWATQEVKAPDSRSLRLEEPGSKHVYSSYRREDWVGGGVAGQDRAHHWGQLPEGILWRRSELALLMEPASL